MWREVIDPLNYGLFRRFELFEASPFAVRRSHGVTEFPEIRNFVRNPFPVFGPELFLRGGSSHHLTALLWANFLIEPRRDASDRSAHVQAPPWKQNWAG